MSRFLRASLVAIAIAAIAFCVGFYSGFRKNFIFDGIVKTVRYLAPNEPVPPAPQLHLDLSDRALLDSTLLPLRQTDFQITREDGAPLQMVALAPAGGDAAVLLSSDGVLFRIAIGSCQDAGCVRQIGRLARPDGAMLDDIYDLVSVDAGSGREWYVSYGQEDRTGFNKSLVISRIPMQRAETAGDIVAVDEPLFRSRSFSLENGHAARAGGGAMVHDPGDDNLIVTVGDYSLNGIGNVYSGAVPPPQSPDSDLGKILRIDRKTGESRIISMGHRNQQGLSLSPDGELISTEHAAKGGDEINLIRQGGNYGWPNVSMGTVYGTYRFPSKPLDPEEDHGGYTAPIEAYLPSPGISDVIHVHDFHEAWDGDLMVATLKARSLFRVRRWKTGSYTEQIYIGDRLRDLAIIQGQMALVTDSGKVILLDPVEDLDLVSSDTGLNTNLNALAECGSCHNVNYPVSSPAAPHLRNILGRPIASAEDYDGYSEGLLARRAQTWTQEALEAYLRAPQGFAPGTAMPDLGLSDEQIAELMSQLPLLR
ncbi:PQQ-dependent sugar dehydrogenase [Paracoccus aerodenitrificans]|uniref:PQQ-dependent sugar dehydrogenase n=1 Tax=Paracoccus aerodenitrificans TaxID=3017781 RepID=UPI0022F012C8|nr:PQQ-dependent sugar dehydrogenase [Paracoccus aerodenitrificans]WBU62704.1 PQQ-dependent sugar dehydrogenase [Paracoccus aerodenitrificans]